MPHLLMDLWVNSDFEKQQGKNMLCSNRDTDKKWRVVVSSHKTKKTLERIKGL